MIVYTGGTFDILHFGHINFLKRCRDIAGINGKVVVSLNPDDFIAKYKGNPPVMTYAEREQSLRQIPYVDEVIPNEGGADSKIAIEKIMPDIIVIASDWARKDYYKQMGFTQDWLDERNICLCYVPYTQGISTTEIKKRLAERAKKK
jgi:glycerol-3-phosphate cytidylyltransferase